MLSVIVNFFNMQREAVNSLFSLSRAYAGAADLEYEVIAIDNGSTSPLSEAFVESFGPQFHYWFMPTHSTSPVEAMNRAAREAAGDQLLIMIDGAHILSPGILPLVEQAFACFEHAFIATLASHLGPNRQDISTLSGYTQAVEDILLRESHWREDGYQLFRAAHAMADASKGWFGCLFESNCFAIRRDDFLSMGGFEERFQSRGGGFANLDFFRRAVTDEKLKYVMLLGEATCHQIHGATAISEESRLARFDEYLAEYKRIRGCDYSRAERRPFFIGALTTETLVWAMHSAAHGLKTWHDIEVRSKQA